MPEQAEGQEVEATLHVPVDRLVGEQGLLSASQAASRCQIPWQLAPSCYADTIRLQGLPMFPSQRCLIS